ncbi:MAG: DUF1295 domain-containing protein [bacterium]
MEIVEAYKISSVAVFAMMVCLWVFSLVTRDASIVDRFWGAGFVLITWVLHLLVPAEAISPVRYSVLALVTVWGLRLSFYIHFRNQGHGEDYRYVEMRNHHGARFWWYSFLSVFTLQGLLMLIVAAPVIFVMSNPEVGNLTNLSIVGLVVWLTGFMFEAGGDWQLASFKRNPANKGKLLREGLWSITRHPNYFGDALQWWGLGCFAIPYGVAASLTLIGPLAMTLFIKKVSGVDLLEKNLTKTKPGYADYLRTTPAFLPNLRFWVILALTCVASVWIFNSLKLS